jgi:hypothetical protein
MAAHPLEQKKQASIQRTQVLSLGLSCCLRPTPTAFDGDNKATEAPLDMGRNSPEYSKHFRLLERT